MRLITGAAESLYDLTFHYGHYLKLHYPVLGFLKGLTIVVLTRFLFPDRIRSAPSMNHQTPKPISAQERMLMFVLAGTLLLWGTDFLHGVSPAWVALAAALVCMLPFAGFFF